MGKITFILAIFISFLLLSSIVSAQFTPPDIISNFFNFILKSLGVGIQATKQKVIPSSGTIVHASSECTCLAGFENPGICRLDAGETITFGNSEIEPNEYGKNDRIYAQKFFVPQSGKVGTMYISVYIHAVSSGNIRLALYRDNNGNPEELLAQTQSMSVSGGQSIWVEGQLQPLQPDEEVTQGESYWLSFFGDSSDIKFRYIISTTKEEKEKVIYKEALAAKDYIFDGFPSSFPSDHDRMSNLISIKASYNSACQLGEKDIGQNICGNNFACCCTPKSYPASGSLLTADNIIRCIQDKNIKLYVYDPTETDCGPCRRQKKLIHYAKGLVGPATLWDQFFSDNVIYAKPPTGFCSGGRPCWVVGSQGYLDCYTLQSLNTLFGCGLTPISGHNYHLENDFV